MREYVTEIISVGTELLLGHVTNTDARDVSEMLSKIGINVLYHTVVGDNPARIENCVKIARDRADIIITTGGLGPTCDDITKEILAKTFGLKLVRNEKEHEGLYDYIRQGRKFTDNNFNQAMLPEGCTVFHNNCGTAPGCAFEKDGKIVLMLPGPPKECRAMLKESALPYLRKLSGTQIVSHTVNVFGIGESTVDDMFAEEMNTMANPSMAPYAKECDCFVKLTAKAESHEAAEEMLLPLVEKVKARIGEYAYGVDVENLEQRVLELLKEKPMTFATAESCTGGLISKSITDVAGCSSVYPGGVCSYSNEMKMKWLDVKKETLDAYGAVSEQTALEMAQGIRNATGADFGLSTTGIAGPGGGSEEKPVGLVYMAVAGENYQQVKKVIIRYGEQTSREMIRQRSAKHALHLLLQAVKTKE